MSLPVDYEPELFNILLEKLENKAISVEEAQRLKPILEKRWRRALIEGPRHLADDLLFALIGLYAYIEGRVSLNDLKIDRVSNVP